MAVDHSSIAALVVLVLASRIAGFVARTTGTGEHGFTLAELDRNGRPQTSHGRLRTPSALAWPVLARRMVGTNSLDNTMYSSGWFLALGSRVAVVRSPRTDHLSHSPTYPIRLVRTACSLEYELTCEASHHPDYQVSALKPLAHRLSTCRPPAQHSKEQESCPYQNNPPHLGRTKIFSRRVA